MANGFVQVPIDSSGKKLQTFENSVGGNTVEASASVIVDSTGVPLTFGDASAANQTALNTLTGAVTETAPATDTASSGLNGRLQRIAQNLTSGFTSLLARFPLTLGQKAKVASFPVVIASDQDALPVTGTFYQATQPVSGSVSVTNLPATQPISGSVAVSNFPGTQPISGTVTATGPLTDTQLRATAVPVSGTVGVSSLPAIPTGSNAIGSVTVSNLPVTQPVSGTVTANAGTGTMAVSGPLTDTQLRATPVQVSGTLGVSSLPALPAGANAIGSVTVSNLPATQATTVVDGADTAQGTTTDAAWNGVNTATIIALLKNAARVQLGKGYLARTLINSAPAVLYLPANPDRRSAMVQSNTSLGQNGPIALGSDSSVLAATGFVLQSGATYTEETQDALWGALSTGNADVRFLTVRPTKATPYLESVLADNPKLLWKLDEAAGSGTVADTSGNGNTGTVGAGVTLGYTASGVPTVDVGQQVSTASFGITSTNTISQAAVAGLLTASGTYNTVECWVNGSQTGASLFAFNDNFFGLLSAATSLGVGSSATNKLTASVASISNSTWHHIVLPMLNGVAMTTADYIFVDGVKSYLSTVGGTIVARAANGSFALDYSATITTGMTYRYSHVAIYAGKLSDERIATHYLMGKGLY